MRFLVISIVLLGHPLAVWALDLQQALEQAMIHAPIWQSAQARNQAAQESPLQARAALKPSVQLTGSQSEVYSKDLALGAGQRYPQSSWTLKARQPFYRKEQFLAVDLADAQLRQADADLELARRDLLVKVASAYVEVMYADEYLVSLQSQLTANESHLAMAQRALTAGEGTRTDIDEAQAQTDRTRAKVLKAKLQQSYAREQLGMLVGRVIDVLQPLDLDIQVVEKQPLDSWLDRVRRNSPRIHAQRARVEIAERASKKASAAAYPTLDMVVTVGASESGTLSTVNSKFKYAQIGLEAVLPLYSGGAQQSMVRQALANLTSERAALRDVELTLELAVRKEYQAAVQGLEALDALAVAHASTKHMVYGVEKGIEAGTRTKTDLLDALTKVAEVKRELAMTRYQAILAIVRLRSLCDSESNVLNY